MAVLAAVVAGFDFWAFFLRVTMVETLLASIFYLFKPCLNSRYHGADGVVVGASAKNARSKLDGVALTTERAVARVTRVNLRSRLTFDTCLFSLWSLALTGTLSAGNHLRVRGFALRLTLVLRMLGLVFLASLQGNLVPLNDGRRIRGDDACRRCGGMRSGDRRCRCRGMNWTEHKGTDFALRKLDELLIVLLHPTQVDTFFDMLNDAKKRLSDAWSD